VVHRADTFTLTLNSLHESATMRDDLSQPMHGPLLLTPLGPGERWYVVQTQPNRETMALVNLQRQGFRTFMPQIIKTVRHARRTRTLKAALFPRYLFTPLDPDSAPWRCINGSLGVVSLIMAGDRPRPVPEGVVESLAALADDSGVVDFGARLEIGRSVRVVKGPFADHLGRLIHLDGQGRAHVLLEIMGAPRTVTISGGALASAGKPADVTGRGGASAGGRGDGDGR
jgi:transcription elongation factor/antiterminator RfaH